MDSFHRPSLENFPPEHGGCDKKNETAYKLYYIPALKPEAGEVLGTTTAL